MLTVSEAAQLRSGTERFTTDDLDAVGELVATTWTAAAGLDWSAPAGVVEWTCLQTADHAVDCVYAPAYFLASRKVDGYPVVGLDLSLGPDATPDRLVESLRIATTMVRAVVADAEPDVRAVIFRRPELLVGAPVDFVPRGGRADPARARRLRGARGAVPAAGGPLPSTVRAHASVADVDLRLARSRCDR